MNIKACLEAAGSSLDKVLTRRIYIIPLRDFRKEEEHAEANQALLAVLELKGTDTQAYDDAVEKLCEAVNHHLTEEELTILNPAREEVAEDVRAQLGEKFATERNRQIDEDCGRVENVRRLVQEARSQGLLDDDSEG